MNSLHPAVAPFVCLTESKNLDKDITLARFGAKKDRVRVVIQRTLQTRSGDTRRIPILEVTPAGDIVEVLAPTLRTPVSVRLVEADLDFRTGGMNRRARVGHNLFTEMVKISRDYLNAESEHEGNRRQRRQHERNARQNINTTSMLSEQAARKVA
jgi:hypothetical protein